MCRVGIIITVLKKDRISVVEFRWNEVLVQYDFHEKKKTDSGI